MDSDSLIAKRKQDHLQIVLEQDVQHRGSTLLDQVQLVHQALPELNLDEIDLSVDFFGKKLNAPILISSMTGGANDAPTLNRDLALAAQHHRIALALGSQRILLKNPAYLKDFAVRPQMPDGILLGNIGAVQLPSLSNVELRSLVENIEADGLCVHLNAAQELCQPEGDRNFRGLLVCIEKLLETLQGKVLVKETGAGFSPQTVEQLKAIGVPYLEVGGLGGTSWTKVEMFRAPTEEQKKLATTFAEWGIPTAVSIVAARQRGGEQVCVIGSGGVQNGLDLAKALTLGADLVGIARPLLIAWKTNGYQGVEAWLKRTVEELRITCLLTGSRDLNALRQTTKIIHEPLRMWLAGLNLL